MRTITISWTTTSAPLPGAFLPTGYRVTIGTRSVVVATSPAVFENFDGAPGIYSASVQLIDAEGAGHGAPIAVEFEVPADVTYAAVPVEAAAVVIVS